MGSVTVYSKAKIDDLMGSDVIGGIISDGEILLQTRDGGTVDVGSIVPDIADASTSLKGIVELATDTETIAGTDTTRAVTPFGLAAIPGTRVLVVSPAKTETEVPGNYPTGVSLMILTSSSWSLNGGNGVVVTYNAAANGCQQTFYTISGGTNPIRMWFRQYHATDGGGGWTAWRENMVVSTLAAGSFTQTTAYTSYPAGWSKIYYTTANSGSWDFTGLAGEVLTYVDTTATFIKQTFTKAAGGSSAYTEVWTRTATSALGWSPWRISMRDALLPDPAVVISNAQTGVTSTSWANHPASGLSISITLPYAAIVTYTLGAWLSIASGSAGDVRAGVSVDGAAPDAVAGGTFGQVLFVGVAASTAGSSQEFVSTTIKLAAGTHTFQVQGMRTGTNTSQVNYPVMRVHVDRWAE